MYYVISYDIKNDKKRTKVMKLLKNHGTHVQFSVFECDVNLVRLTKLVQDMRKIIDKKTDNIRIYYLCEYCQKNIQLEGNAEDVTIEEVIVV
jgi:CRISPR-associated protein Cas2